MIFAVKRLKIITCLFFLRGVLFFLKKEKQDFLKFGKFVFTVWIDRNTVVLKQYQKSKNKKDGDYLKGARLNIGQKDDKHLREFCFDFEL